MNDPGTGSCLSRNHASLASRLSPLASRLSPLASRLSPLDSEEADYRAFLRVVGETLRLTAVRICGSCVMPNHWHFLLWAEADDDLSTFMLRSTEPDETWPLTRPLPCGPSWLAQVNQPQTEGEVEAIRRAIRRSSPSSSPSCQP